MSWEPIRPGEKLPAPYSAEEDAYVAGGRAALMELRESIDGALTAKRGNMPKITGDDWRKFRDDELKAWGPANRVLLAHDLKVADLHIHAKTLAAIASKLLTGLAQGKYDDQVKVTEEILNKIGVLFPPAAQAEKALEIFLWINRVTAPAGRIIPDGRGGFVPETNSRYDPETGEFL